MLSLETLETSKRLGIGRKIQKMIVIAVVGDNPQFISVFSSVVILTFLENFFSQRTSLCSGVFQMLYGRCTDFSLQLYILIQEPFNTSRKRCFTVRPRRNLSPIQDM